MVFATAVRMRRFMIIIAAFSVNMAITMVVIATASMVVVAANRRLSGKLTIVLSSNTHGYQT